MPDEKSKKVVDAVLEGPIGYKLWDCEIEGCNGAVIGGWEGKCTECGMGYGGDPGEPSRFAWVRFVAAKDMVVLRKMSQAFMNIHGLKRDEKFIYDAIKKGSD